MADDLLDFDALEFEKLQNPEAERRLLHAILSDCTTLDELNPCLQPGHFADLRNAAVFRRAMVLRGEGAEVSHQVLMGYLWFDEYVTEAHLDWIISVQPDEGAPDNPDDLARLVIELSMLRDLVRLGGQLAQAAADANLPVSEIIGMAEAWLGRIRDFHGAGPPPKLAGKMCDQMVSRPKF